MNKTTIEEDSNYRNHFYTKHNSESKDNNSAEKALKEAILQDENDREAQLMLAEHYLRTENLETCAQLCNHLIKTKTDPEVLAILANLNFKKGDVEAGISNFKKLFEIKPDHYDALCTVIKFLYRAGKIEEAKEFFDKIDSEFPKAPTEPGYNYSMGIFYQLSSKPTEALRYFNKCRGDKMYGKIASLMMAELCLNPDNEIRFDENWRKNSLNQKQDSSKISQETAIKLLQTSQEKPNDLRFKIMENYCLMHSNDKLSLEKALESFVQLENIHKDHPSVLKGIAECYMLLKQVPKARNYLKRALTISWNSEDAEDLEKCWLLLAATYMSGGKYDQAQACCKKCLEYNKSCTKAYEFMGTILEREAAYKDASEYYYKAWTYGNKNQPNVGFKLAFNYLKDKKYIQAIDIAHYVIEKFPDFPKIRKEILEKARHNYRI